MIYAQINFTVVIHFNFMVSSIEFISFQQHKTPIYIPIQRELNRVRTPEPSLRIYHLYKCPIQISYIRFQVPIFSFLYGRREIVHRISYNAYCLLGNSDLLYFIKMNFAITVYAIVVCRNKILCSLFLHIPSFLLLAVLHPL